jgi:hypothetical protein
LDISFPKGTFELVPSEWRRHSLINYSLFINIGEFVRAKRLFPLSPSAYHVSKSEAHTNSPRGKRAYSVVQVYMT